VCHRPVLGGRSDIDECFDVINDRSDLERNAGRWDKALGYLVHEVILIAGGIIISQQVNTNRRALASLLNRFDGALLLRFDSNNRVSSTDGLFGQQHAAHQFHSLFFHQNGIFME
jgi:hypothetical protein